MSDKCFKFESIKLGFVEKCAPALCTNRYFPCKVGGKPAWLELKNLPKNEDILCPKCNEPRIFLCQIYAPIERDDCFHRTIYIFICRNESCYELNSSENIVVFRSQLPRINDFYSEHQPDENLELPEVKGPLKLCYVCGCKGQLECKRCKKVNYCGQKHEAIDSVFHEKICGNDKIDVNTSQRPEILFPEYNIYSDDEEDDDDEEEEEEDGEEEKEEKEGVDSKAKSENLPNSVGKFNDSDDDSENDELSEKKRLQEFEEFVKTGKAGDLKDIPESELSKFITENVEDEQFLNFKKQIESYPKQVIRYQICGHPLWISNEPTIVKENKIPNCEYCNSKRVFEFQIMPQLLSFLNNDKIDWGVIAVYTCSNSCATNSQYLKEFVIKQDILPVEKK